jgi:ammonia channel protein AmtB
MLIMLVCCHVPDTTTLCAYVGIHETLRHHKLHYAVCLAVCLAGVLLQVPLYALNQHLVFKVLQGLDMGGSITIHAFGAYYGLAASLMLSNGRQAPGAYTSANIKNSATYTSDLFSMIGTIFLWMYW